MAETHPEKNPKKKLIVLIAIILLLVGGAAGGYFFFMHKAADVDHGEKTAEAGHEEEAAKHEEVVEPDVYYNVPAPFLVNFPPGSSAKVIKINITLLMKGEAGVAALKKHEPMIRNNLLMAISSIGVEKAKTTEGKQELRALMLDEIGKVLEKMTGKNTVKELYFTEFVMQ
jgi:flagellar FliL protein